MTLWWRDLKEFNRINHQPFNHWTDSYWALWCIRLTLGSNKIGNPWSPCNSYCTGRTRLGIKDSRRSLLTLPPVNCMTLDIVLNATSVSSSMWRDTYHVFLYSGSGLVGWCSQSNWSMQVSLQKHYWTKGSKSNIYHFHSVTQYEEETINQGLLVGPVDKVAES